MSNSSNSIEKDMTPLGGEFTQRTNSQEHSVVGRRDRLLRSIALSRRESPKI
jgi:hypothetical protein